MKKHKTIKDKRNSENKVVYYAIQLVLLSIILIKCFYIIQPFINLLIWGIIFGIILQPLHHQITKRLKGRKALAASLITVSMLLLIIVPSAWLTFASIEEVKILKNAIQSDQINIPIPKESVKDWPIIGEKTYRIWDEAYQDKSTFVLNHSEEIKPIALKIISLLSSVGKGMLLFIGSIILGGFLLVYSDSFSHFSSTFIKK